MMNYKNRFKIEISEGNESNKVDAIIDVNCDLKFLTDNLARAIYEVTKTVEKDAPGLFTIKNGFWLVVSDIVNELIAKNAETGEVHD